MRRRVPAREPLPAASAHLPASDDGPLAFDRDTAAFCFALTQTRSRPGPVSWDVCHLHPIGRVEPAQVRGGLVLNGGGAIWARR
jgi:hypothetical protein